MKIRRLASSRSFSVVMLILFCLDGPRLLMAEPTREAVAAFNAYCQSVQARVGRQHRSPGAFLVLASDSREERLQLQGGKLVLEQLSSPNNAALSRAMLHHWRGTAFVAGATPADFERLMRDFHSYPQRFAPEVLAAKTISVNGDEMRAWMRVRQHHVITVVMDSTYDIAYGQLDARHGYSISRSTQVEEMQPDGNGGERALGPDEEHGFLWRLNTYWSYEEGDGGLYLQVEVVSLTRSIPRGLGWAVRPYVESVPRESLEFTLRSACNALRR